MSMQDPISDLLTRIRNGLLASKQRVSVPFSKIKQGILDVLVDEGYLVGYEVASIDASKQQINVDLKYYEGKPVIATIDRASRPGLRLYKSKDELPKVQGNLGIAVISTSQGVVSDRKARELGVGGEVLCTVT